MMTNDLDLGSDSASLVLTGHELAFILRTIESPSADRTRDLLKLSAEADMEGAEIYGMTTLLARKLGHLVGRELELDGHARHVAVALAHADAWGRVAVLSGGLVQVGVIARAPRAAILLLAQELGTYDIRPLDPMLDVQASCLDIARQFLAATAGDLMCTAELVNLDGPFHGATVLVEGDSARLLRPGASEQSDAEAVRSTVAVEAWISAFAVEPRRTRASAEQETR